MPKRNDAPDDYAPVYLTQSGVERSKKRLKELKSSLPRLIADVAQAAAQGDRSDNDAYTQSKSLLRRTHRQIWSIEDQLRRTVIIHPGRNPAGTVQLGSRVTLETAEGGRKLFELVGPHETNPARGRISHESPLGKALLGRVEGDAITIETANGMHAYKIIEIR